VSEFGKRFARSLLCLMAPLLGGLALTFTSRASQAFALPVACAALMSWDLAGSALATALGPMGVVAILPSMLLLAAGMLALLMQQTIVRQHALVKPGLVSA
jgi:hypothetical protein